MSFNEEPPVEAMTGFFVLAIFSIKIQSLISELASFMISIPSSVHKSTDLSSNGVAIGIRHETDPALGISGVRALAA